MTMRLTLKAEWERMDVIRRAFGDSAVLSIYEGARPETPDDPIPEKCKLLVSARMAPFVHTGKGDIECREIGPAKVIVNGWADWFRITDSEGAPIMDGRCGGYDFKLKRIVQPDAQLMLNAVFLERKTSVEISHFRFYGTLT